MTNPASAPEPLSARDIEQAFLTACRAELDSLKPGNVHVFADGHRMDTAMFEAAARAAAPFVAQTDLPVGERIQRAVAASMAACGCNTNLGIVLLCVPLASAAVGADGPLRIQLDGVLDALTVDDARGAYAAIAQANPAGLGTVPAHDVAAPPTVTLLEAMTLARGHDRIANAYANDFADLFDFALPALTTARLSALTPQRAVTTLHMCLLSQFADTHIERKHGAQTARQVQVEAHRQRQLYLPFVDDSGFAALSAFDADLKQRGINPGTTADFVVATLFAEQLLKRKRMGISE